MRKTPCFATVIAGLQIAMYQMANGSFTVVYGKQKFTSMGYQKAAKELGECIMHALACDSKINNEVR
jgi:hypothetical protein